MIDSATESNQAGALLVNEVEPGYAAQIRTRVFDLLEGQQVEQLERAAEAILTPLRGECVDLLPPRPGR
ncbi:hypothetical protein [Microbacterium thalli]|uniref:hypothetical protein n=1 Tax=Microbacterium thalli TaxID=3027921 RepID=UPI002366ED28|nr:hypothetical protein [Microbacterium thalli]MDD7928087.1 hypothetical protein [Microbacterium thalli]